MIDDKKCENDINASEEPEDGSVVMLSKEQLEELLGESRDERIKDAQDKLIDEYNQYLMCYDTIAPEPWELPEEDW